MLISPRNTLTSCGSSSRLVLRSRRPTRVMRESSVSLYGASGSSESGSFAQSRRIASRWMLSWALWRSVRNLKQLNGFSSRPIRRCRKTAGPGLSRRIAIDTIMRTGASSTIARTLIATSSARLPNSRAIALRRVVSCGGNFGTSHRHVPPPKSRLMLIIATVFVVAP